MGKLSVLTEKMKKHKKMLIVGAIVVAVAGTGVAIVNNMNQKKEQMMAMMNQVQTAKVERRTLVSSVSATGTVTSVDSKNVSANLNGMEVKSVEVEVGDIVEAGQILCVLDTSDIEEELADARTALRVANEKTKIDLVAAERNLNNAEQDYVTDVERANEDLNSVYIDYAEAVEDEYAARVEWIDAQNTTIEKKAEYDSKKEKLDKLEEKQDSMESASTYSQKFNIKKAELSSYAAGHGVKLNNAIESKLVVGDSFVNISDISVGTDEEDDFYLTGIVTVSGNNGIASNDQIKDKIWEYLYALKSINSSYQTRMDLDEEYSDLKSEVATLEAEHKTAEAEETAAEKAYDQAVATTESQLSTFEKQQQNLADTAKNDQNTILGRSESLYTSQLNSLSSGDSETERIKEYQEQLQDCTIKAPISGVITAVNVEAGDIYNGSTVVTIEDASAFEVTTEIDEYDIGKIKKGQKVIIKTNATGDEEMEGTVKTVAPRASSGSSEVTYKVTISVDTMNELLRMDMTAKLSIILDSKENILTVPYESVQEDENGKFYVEVVMDSSGSEEGETLQKPEGTGSGKAPQKPGGMGNDETTNSMNTNSRNNGKDAKMLGSSGNAAEMNTRKVYVEKGIESDYYIEIISNEITEGMEVVVPDSEGKGMNLQMMMRNQGPMGGF